MIEGIRPSSYTNQPRHKDIFREGSLTFIFRITIEISLYPVYRNNDIVQNEKKNVLIVLETILLDEI